MKKFFALILALALLASFAGAAMAEQPISVELWTLFTGDDGVTMTAIVDAFNASQDKVQLTHVAIDRENLYTKLALAINDEAALPELFVTYSYDVPYFVNLGYIQAMDDTLGSYEAFDFAIEKYHDACAELNYFDGQRYCVSLDFPTWGMYVNNALAEQYCPEVLEDDILTWDEIAAVGEKLAADGVEDVTVLAASWARNDLLNSYLELAGNYATEDGTTLALNQEAAAEMIKTWKESYDAGYLWEDGDDASTLFANEECIFFTGGTWNMNAINQFGFDFSFIAPPQFSAEGVTTLFGASHAFMMPTRSYTADESFAISAFMHYFYENSIDWAMAGSIVASKATAASDAYQALPQAFVSNNYGISNPNFTYAQILFDVLDSLGWESVYGRMSPEDFAETWAKQTQGKIDAQ
jgi:multiple sugar transport system substrate-binding protein